MNDLFHSLLEYLNTFPLDYTSRPINDFLIKIGYDRKSQADAKIIKSVIIALENRKFIECTTVLFHELFAEDAFGFNEATGKHDRPTNRNLDDVTIEVQITSIGKLYIDQRARELKQQDLLEKQTNSVRSTNTFTKINMALTFLLALYLAYLQTLSVKKDDDREAKQSRKEAQDSIWRQEVNKTALELKTELHQISLSLKDTSKVRVKIEK